VANNKLRSSLTSCFQIIIGNASVIAMIGIVRRQKYISKELNLTWGRSCLGFQATEKLNALNSRLAKNFGARRCKSDRVSSKPFHPNRYFAESNSVGNW
jgi:hypothetical protein